ncbi:MAG: hypothetical protein AAF742_05770 [Pseudomonadota bacterium]
MGVEDPYADPQRSNEHAVQVSRQSPPGVNQLVQAMRAVFFRNWPQYRHLWAWEPTALACGKVFRKYLMILIKNK